MENRFWGRNNRVGLLLILTAVGFLSPWIFTEATMAPGDLLYRGLAIDPARSAHNPFLADVIEQVYPYSSYFRQEVTEGRVSLWNPFVLSGAPFHANTVSAVFFPLNWLLLLVPLTQSLEAGALLKLVLAGLGIFSFCRHLGAGHLGAGFAGICYMFSGYLIHFLLFPNAWVTALVGWVLLATERLVTDPHSRWRRCFVLAVILGVCFYSGHVESALLLAAASMLYGSVRNYRAAGYLLASGVWAALIAGAAVLPFLEYLGESATFLSRSEFARNPYFLPLDLLPGLFLPFLQGSPAGSQSLDVSISGVVYVGLAPLFVLLVGYWPSRAGNQPLLWVAVSSLLILFGVPPLFDLFTALPLLRQGNHLHVVQLLQASLCAMTGLALDSFIRRGGNLRRLAAGALASLVALAVAGLLYLDPTRNPEAAARLFFFAGTESTVPLHLWLEVLMLLLTGFLLWTRRFTFLPLAAVLHGVLFAAGFYPTVDPAPTLDAVPAFAEGLQRYPHERFVAIGKGFVPPNFPMVWRARDFRGYESVVPRTVPHFYGEMIGREANPHHFVPLLDRDAVRLLRRAGVSLIVKPGREVEGLEPLIGQFPPLYRLQNSWRVHWASAAVHVPSIDAALAFALQAEDPTVVAIEGETGAGRFAEAEDPAAGIRWIQDLPDTLQLELATESEGLLVLRDTWFPGWEASLDGIEVPIQRCDGLFRAVFIPAGGGNLRVEYRPESFHYGVALSALGLVVAVAVWGGSLWRGRRRGA